MLAPATNLGTGLRSAKTEIVRGHWDRVHQFLAGLATVKTAAHLAELSGISISAWHKSMREKRSISSDALVSLLHTEHGWDLLRALMGDAQPRWWLDLKAAAELEQIKRERDALNKRIEEMEHR